MRPTLKHVFWWNLWWFELILNAFWRLCRCKLTATFIVTAKCQNCVFGEHYFGDLTFLRHIVTEIMTLFLLGAFLVEFVVVRINRKHILAFVPITNDGNNYLGTNMYFWDGHFQFWSNNGLKSASKKRSRTNISFCDAILRIAE